MLLLFSLNSCNQGVSSEVLSNDAWGAVTVEAGSPIVIGVAVTTEEVGLGLEGIDKSKVSRICEELDEAVTSWVDNVYLPVVQLIREKELLGHFPDNSESDLYVWIVSRRADLERDQSALGQTLNEKIIEDLERECRSSSIVHLAQHFLQQLNHHSEVVS